jgi:hypothetical protein
MYSLVPLALFILSTLYALCRLRGVLKLASVSNINTTCIIHRESMRRHIKIFFVIHILNDGCFISTVEGLYYT